MKDKNLMFFIRIMFWGVLLLSAIYFKQSNSTKETTKTEINVPTETSKIVNLEFLQLEIDKLKRQVNGLIEYDKEHWLRYVESQKANNKTVFPRTDYYCPDKMIGYKIYNVCEEEDDKYYNLLLKTKIVN